MEDAHDLQAHGIAERLAHVDELQRDDTRLPSACTNCGNYLAVETLHTRPCACS